MTEKKLMRFLVVCLVAVVCMGAILNTSRDGYKTVRTAVGDATDAALGTTGTARTWGNRDAAKCIKPPSNWNEVECIFSGSTAGAMATVEVWGYRERGVAILQWRGMITLEASLVDDDGNYLCGTGSETDDETIGGAELRDNSGSGVLTLWFDDRYKYVKVLFPTVSAGTMNCKMSGS